MPAALRGNLAHLFHSPSTFPRFPQANTKSLLDLDAQLLDRLSSNTGNLLDDESLIDVLANTKAKAAEVKEKLAAADETKKSIGEKREQFRPVATRGSVLYFAIVETSLVLCMYQTSLSQFVELFMKSMEVAEKAALATKRVLNIIDSMTYVTYRYINKGLYERDKLLFVFLVACKIMVTAGLLDMSEVQLFLRGGAALSIDSVRKKPNWISNESWLNVMAISEVPFFKSLPDSIVRNDAIWRRWYDDNEPERLPIPDLEASIKENKETGPWRRLLLIRSLRMDRTLLCVRQFVRDLEGLGEKYVEPVTDTIDMVFDEMTAYVPVIFLLSTGADPTDSIEQLAKKKKTSVVCVSLGEGQEPVAMKAMSAAAVNGTWVLLQNCDLGLDLMDKMEEVLTKMRDASHVDFRLFITSLPNPLFPLGLLQMSTKVTNEPPAGMRAGVLRSYTVMVDQDRLERLDMPEWRKLVFAMCFQHSAVQERRKFGPLGWAYPLDSMGAGDLSACLMFLEKHLYQGPISWPTVQYIISECQYGGKVTDTYDRRLFNTYTALWISLASLQPNFTYNPKEPISKIPGDFVYKINDFTTLEQYRAYISTMPEIDSPEIYGLHPNADLTFRVKEVNALLATMADTQPKSSGGGSGKSMDDIVKEKAIELSGQLPEDYIEEEYKVKIRKIGGMGEPLNIFLYQEIQRLQNVIFRCRTMLKQMVQAIDGEVVMTAELQQAMLNFFDAKVPQPWLFTPGGDEFSWQLFTLGIWFAGLKEREVQLTTWLNGGRPLCFWMTGFSNPQGFLTSMKQEVTRQHRAQLWALDEIDYHTEVTDFMVADQVKSQPKEGVYVHGLWMDSARWDKANGTLTESEPKKLFAPLPVLYVTAMTKPLLADKRKSMGELYEAPTYRYPFRHDRSRVFQAYLPSKNNPNEHWILRGMCLLCITAQQ